MAHLPDMDGQEKAEANELTHLRERNEYLEESVRWHRFAFDLLQDTTELIGNDGERLNKNSILSAAYEQLSRILDWEAVGFLLIDEDNQEFELEFCRPVEHTDFLLVEVEKLIDSGQFAWALNQNHEMVLKSFGWDCNLILHVLATRARIRGMFIGVPAMNYDELPDSSLQLISLVLSQVVYSLESASLYDLLSNKKDDLQTLVSQRTRQLEFQHQHDPLTQRPNRRYLIQNLSEFVKQSDDKGRALAVLRCDIVGFKRINEIYGFSGGDSVIKELSDRLVSSAEEVAHGTRLATEAHVTRIASDHFCIVFVSVKDESRLQQAAERILAIIEKPFVLDHDEIALGMRIGLSVYPTDATKPDQVFSHAETALYAAKQRGANVMVRYEKAMHGTVAREVKMASNLRAALQRDAFTLEFEAQVDLYTQSVVASQSLLKWQPPNESTIEHNELMESVDTIGIGVPFTEYVVAKCAESLRILANEGFPQIAMIVDISKGYFRQDNVDDRFLSTLQEYHVEPSRVEIAVSEQVISENMARSKRVLDNLHKHGVKIWIRNVGMGDLSLQYLKVLPIFGLKFDARLSQDIAMNDDDPAIIRALTSLGHHFGVVVSLPGIDTEQQVEAIENTQCERAQGFFFGQPLQIDKFANYLRGRSRG